MPGLRFLMGRQPLPSIGLAARMMSEEYAKRRWWISGFFRQKWDMNGGTLANRVHSNFVTHASVVTQRTFAASGGKLVNYLEAKELNQLSQLRKLIVVRSHTPEGSSIDTP
jgi:hypothetical protein